jgi:toxin ParE1/3/4
LRIRWRPLAEADRDGIVDYIAQNNGRAALELGDTIERRVEELAEQPRLFRPCRVRGTREMVVHPNYVVVYRIKRDEIEIVRVLHTSRQWPLSR